MLYFQNPVFITRFTALLFFAIGMGFSFWSPQKLATGFIWGSSIAAIVGSLLCVLTPFAFTKIVPIAKNFLLPPTLNKMPKPFGLLRLLSGQLALFLISFLLFTILEVQTSKNLRLQSLPLGYFFELIQSHIFTLAVLPWLTYTVVGVGLGFFCVCLKRIPLLPTAIISRHKRHPWLFIHNFLMVIFDVVTLYPFIFIVSFTIVILCETLNISLAKISLFNPYALTPFVLVMLLLVFLKVNLRVIEKIDKHKIALGKMFLVYIIIFSILLFYLHYLTSELLTQYPIVEENIKPIMQTKSTLVGSFSETDRDTRLMLLIWGWWGIWIPWMASLVARFSMGLSVSQAFLKSILFPVVIFALFIFKITVSDWVKVEAYLLEPPMIFFIPVILLLFIYYAWGNIRTTADIARGCLPSSPRLHKRSLQPWLSVFFLWLTCYLPAWLMLGWVPLQVIVTLGTGFTSLLVFAFIFSLIKSLFFTRAKFSLKPREI